MLANGAKAAGNGVLIETKRAPFTMTGGAAVKGGLYAIVNDGSWNKMEAVSSDFGGRIWGIAEEAVAQNGTGWFTLYGDVSAAVSTAGWADNAVLGPASGARLVSLVTPPSGPDPVYPPLAKAIGANAGSGAYSRVLFNGVHGLVGVAI